MHCGAFVKFRGETTIVSFTIPALLEDMTKTKLSVAWSVATLCAATAAPLCGGIIKRFPENVCLTVASLCMGASLVIFAFSFNYGTLLLAFILLRTSALALLDTWPVVCLNGWFVHNRGVVVSRASLFTNLLCGAFSAVVSQLISEYGWRKTSLIEAISCACVSVLSLVLLRGKWTQAFYDSTVHPVTCEKGRYSIKQKQNKSPRLLRLHQGLNKPEKQPLKATLLSKPEGLTLAQAKKTRAFWLLIASMTLSSTVASGTYFYLPVIIREEVGATYNIGYAVIRQIPTLQVILVT